MSQATIRGNVHVIEETKTYGQKGFRKRLVVLEDASGRFPSYIPVEFIQDSCESVDELSLGDDVEVTYRLSGRKWQRDEQSEVKYFLSAEAVSFRILGSAADNASGGPASPVDEVPAGTDDEVPF